MPEPGEVLDKIRNDLEPEVTPTVDPQAQVAPEDDETFVSRAEKEGVKVVPYDRFKKVYGGNKENAAWRKDNEPKIKTMTAQMEHLRQRISKFPHMQKALVDLLDSEDGSMNQEELLAALQEAVKAKPAGATSAPAQLDQAALTKQILDQVRSENELKEIQRSIDNQFARMPALLKDNKDFEGLDVSDQGFLDDVEDQLLKDSKSGEATGTDLKAEIIAAATKVAKKYHSIQGRVLERQVAGAGRKAGAAAIPTKPGAGGAKTKPPDPNTDPDGFDAYMEKKARQIDAELQG